MTVGVVSTYVVGAKDGFQRVGIVGHDAAAVDEAHAMGRGLGGHGVVDSRAQLGDGGGRGQASESEAALQLGRGREHAQVERGRLVGHGGRHGGDVGGVDLDERACVRVWWMVGGVVLNTLRFRVVPRWWWVR